MKDSTIVIIVVAGAALLFWAVSSGLIKTTGGAIPVGKTGVLAPQPGTNYSGYLAVSAAPALSGAINTAISGLGSTFAAWVAPKTTSGGTTTAGQSANPLSPAKAAQPSGPGDGTTVITAQLGPSPTAGLSTYASYDNTLVGPQVNSDVSYAATPGSAFDYSGLTADNAYDPSYSLQDPLFAL